MGASQLERLRQAKAGRKLKRPAGIKSESSTYKQAGLERRRAQLLPEYLDRHRKGQLVDRRFGESNVTLSPEDRALQRFTRERQRKQSLFDLEHDEADEGLTHFGASLGEDPPLQQVERESDPVNKSRAEIYAEVISKSKAYKADRQRARDADDEARMELDKDLDNLRGVLQPLEVDDAITSTDQDKKYDRELKELAYEPRGTQASDRLQSEAEQAAAAKLALETAQAARIQRMQGVEDEGPRRRAEADDLDDNSAEMGSPELTRLGIDVPLSYGKDAQGELRLTGHLAPGSDSTEEEEEGDDSDAESLGSDAGLDVDGLLSDSAASSIADDLEEQKLPSATALGKRRENVGCPQTHDELVGMLGATIDDAQALDAALQRIRTLYHPKLGGENKQRMGVFIGVLLDHVLCGASTPSQDVAILDAVVPHLFALCTLCPLAAAEHCISRLRLMHKNLLKGLQHGPTESKSRTWPLLPELLMLRIIGLLWSTSDESHPVGALAQLLLGQYLSQCRIRGATDLASGLYCCTLCLQYESVSMRVCPEAINFLGHALRILLPAASSWAHSSLPALQKLRLGRNVSSTNAGIGLARMLSQAEPYGLAQTALQLVARFAELLASKEAFAELFDPLASLLAATNKADLPDSLATLHAQVATQLQRMITMTRHSRKPLLLQQHRAVPLASFAPKFDDGAGKRSFDPDTERAEASKLRALHRKERKGAVRELRKDARFLAEHKAHAQRAADDTYRKKINSISASLQTERSDQKKEERHRKRRKK